MNGEGDSTARLRFSLRGLLGSIVIVGLGIAALRHPNLWWTTAAVGLTSLALGWVLVVAASVRPLRPFAVGFASAGIFYMTLWSVFQSPYSMYLPTSVLCYYLMSWAIPFDWSTMTIGKPGGPYAELHWTTQFYAIFQCLATLLIALLGGLFASRLVIRRQPAEVRPEVTSS